MNPYSYILLIRKKKWISKDKRPVVKVTGSHNKTIIFGCLFINTRKQLFRQYKKFDSSIFVDYLKQLQKRFGKCIVFVDRATPHCSKVTKAYLDANKDTIRLEYFPIGAPEFNDAIEECCRQGKYHILSSYYPTFNNLKDTICSYYRTKRFNSDIIKYLFRQIT